MAIARGLVSFWVCLVAEDRGGVPAAVARGLAHFKAELIANSQEGNAPAPITKEVCLAIAGGARPLLGLPWGRRPSVFLVSKSRKQRKFHLLHTFYHKTRHHRLRKGGCCVFFVRLAP